MAQEALDERCQLSLQDFKGRVLRVHVDAVSAFQMILQESAHVIDAPPLLHIVSAEDQVVQVETVFLGQGHCPGGRERVGRLLL